MPRIPCPDLRRMVAEYLGRNSVAPDHAEIIADVLVEAELRGKKGHGLIRLDQIVSRYVSVKRSDIRLVSQKGGMALLDAGMIPGYVAAHRAAQMAASLADQFGVSSVGLRNTTHCGMLGYYTDIICRSNKIGIATCNCFPRVTPLGGRSPVFGTNPVAVSIPTDEHPLTFDASLASVTNGQLKLLSLSGESLEPGIAFSKDGTPTVDPEEAISGAVTPFGGHKGYGLILISQLMTTALVGGPLMPPPGQQYGIFIAAIDPGVFVPISDFKRACSEMLRIVKAVSAADQETPIRIPGERSWRTKQKNLEEGIDVDEQTFRKIQHQ